MMTLVPLHVFAARNPVLGNRSQHSEAHHEA